MIEFEIELLTLYAKEKKCTIKVFELLRKNKKHLNDVGINGPLFNLLLGTRVFMTLGIVIEMLQNGFKLDHENNVIVVHKALLNSITTCYSDGLYNVLELLCSSAKFIETIPIESLLDVTLKTIYDPDPVVINLLLQYDKERRIKTELLNNTFFYEKFRCKYPTIFDLIINY